MRQDIHLLGGIMLKTKALYFEIYNIYITTKITLSSLALTISRFNFYNDIDTPIAIPHRTADEFLRRAYYGGHSDVYNPHGNNLYYYDINSLYPYVMKECPMPIGPGKWYGNLINHSLDGLYGFREAYVKCPDDINKPFLPGLERCTAIPYW